MILSSSIALGASHKTLECLESKIIELQDSSARSKVLFHQLDEKNSVELLNPIQEKLARDVDIKSDLIRIPYGNQQNKLALEIEGKKGHPAFLSRLAWRLDEIYGVKLYISPDSLGLGVKSVYLKNAQPKAIIIPIESIRAALKGNQKIHPVLVHELVHVKVDSLLVKNNDYLFQGSIEGISIDEVVATRGALKYLSSFLVEKNVVTEGKRVKTVLNHISSEVEVAKDYSNILKLYLAKIENQFSNLELNYGIYPKSMKGNSKEVIEVSYISEDLAFKFPIATSDNFVKKYYNNRYGTITKENRGYIKNQNLIIKEKLSTKIRLLREAVNQYLKDLNKLSNDIDKIKDFDSKDLQNQVVIIKNTITELYKQQQLFINSYKSLDSF